jgi:uncharacterized protein DUF4262
MKPNRASRRRRRASRGVAGHLSFIRSAITNYGFAVQGVSASWHEPGWAYTIGLHTHGLPELIVVGGMSPADQHCAIDELARRTLDGDVIEPGRVDSDVIDGFDVTYVEVVDTGTDWFAVANRLQSGFRALQVVWPDLDGRFPWEDGYDIPVEYQCLLGLPATA